MSIHNVVITQYTYADGSTAWRKKPKFSVIGNRDHAQRAMAQWLDMDEIVGNIVDAHSRVIHIVPTDEDHVAAERAMATNGLTDEQRAYLKKFTRMPSVNVEAEKAKEEAAQAKAAADEANKAAAAAVEANKALEAKIAEMQLQLQANSDTQAAGNTRRR